MKTRTHLIWVTSADTSTVNHAVSDAAMAAALAGRYPFVGLCGGRFWPAALCAPPGSPCARCVLVVRASLPTDGERMGAPVRCRPGWWSRLRAALPGSSPIAVLNPSPGMSSAAAGLVSRRGRGVHAPLSPGPRPRRVPDAGGELR